MIYRLVYNWLHNSRPIMRKSPVFTLTASLFTVVFISLYCAFAFIGSGNSLALRMKRDTSPIPASIPIFRNFDPTTNDIPEEIQNKVHQVEVKSETITVGGVRVHKEEAAAQHTRSQPLTVLLLHGMAFSSQTWIELETVQYLSAMGYRAIAVDLPGYGKSSGLGSQRKGSFLKKLIEELQLNPKRLVIVSPSMSGGFSIDYLRENPQLFGFIPVAPVNANGIAKTENKACSVGKITKEDITHHVLSQHLPSTLPDLSCYTTKTMVTFGENDSSGFLSGCALLNTLPYSIPAMIPGAGHACYRQNPQLWHKMLYNFLGYISKM